MGRPRIPGAPSSAERTRASVRARVAAGWRQQKLLLSPEAAAALDAIRARDGCTVASAIERSLARFAKLSRPSV